MLIIFNNTYTTFQLMTSKQFTNKKLGSMPKILRRSRITWLSFCVQLLGMWVRRRAVLLWIGWRLVIFPSHVLLHNEQMAKVLINWLSFSEHRNFFLIELNPLLSFLICPTQQKKITWGKSKYFCVLLF